MSIFLLPTEDEIILTDTTIDNNPVNVKNVVEITKNEHNYDSTTILYVINIKFSNNNIIEQTYTNESNRDDDYDKIKDLDLSTLTFDNFITSLHENVDVGNRMHINSPLNLRDALYIQKDKIKYGDLYSGAKNCIMFMFPQTYTYQMFETEDDLNDDQDELTF